MRSAEWEKPNARSPVFIPHSALRIPHSERSQSVISSARRSAKAEVRGANPRESTILKIRNPKVEIRSQPEA